MLAKKIMVALTALVAFSSIAHADKILAPGEMTKIGGQRVYCSGESSDVDVYQCSCGYTVVGAWQDFGTVKFKAGSEEDVQAKALSLCKGNAANPTQERLMRAVGCESMTGVR